MTWAFLIRLGQAEISANYRGVTLPLPANSAYIRQYSQSFNLNKKPPQRKYQ